MSDTSGSILCSIENTIQSPLPLVESHKRKRPPKLEIPPVPEEEKPVEPEFAVSAGGVGWGVYSVRGKGKKSMEDAFQAVPDLCCHTAKGVFGVFDGHGGKKAAAFAAENLHGNILGVLEENLDIAKVDAVRAGFLKTDKEFLDQGVGSGSCCLITLIGKDDITISNLGDCRAVLCRGGVAQALTVDHNTNQINELKRIHEKGGFVEYHHGALRVQGTLAVTRSIGDGYLKDWISAEPDTVLFPSTSDMDFLILASDGLWNKVGNQEAVDTVLHLRLNSPNMKRADNKLIRKTPKERFACENTSPATRESTSTQSHRKNNQTFYSNSPSPIIANNKMIREVQQQQSKRTSPLLMEKTSPYQCRDQNENQVGVFKLHKTSHDKKLKLGFMSADEEQKSVCLIPKTQTRAPTKYVWGSACEKLAAIATSRGSLDDITVMIIDLKQFFSS